MTLRRRRLAFKVVALVALLSLVGAACTVPPPPTGGNHAYKSTSVTPPVANVTPGVGTPGDGLLFTSINGTPPGVRRGFTIYDDSGEPVWSRPDTPGLPMTADLKVVDWGGGEKALAMYEGELFPGELGVSTGEVTVLDSNYDEIGVFGPVYSPQADLHDFLVTDTSFFYLIYDPVTMDLSSYGGLVDATVYDAVIQEVSRATGQVVWEWHSLENDRIPITDTNRPLTLPTVDYLHVNSLELDGDGNILISARTADALYMINKTTKEVDWKLGGTNGTPSDFTFPNDVGFLFQHDARILPDGTIGLFDNGSNARPFSRGVRYDLDFGTMEATMVQELRHDPEIYGFAMGNVHWLPNGNAVVGWGTEGGFTEFDAAGNVVLDGTYPSFDSYRTQRFEWVGTPSAPPDAIVWPGEVDTTDIFMSWNGSTETAQWLVEGGPPGNLSPLVTVPKDGFETQVSLTTDFCDFAVTPLDSGGNPLAPRVELGWKFPWTCPTAA